MQVNVTPDTQTKSVIYSIQDVSSHMYTIRKY